MNSKNKRRDILTCFAITEFSNRKISKVYGVSHTTVGRYRNIYLENNLDLEKVEQLSDTDIEKLLGKKSAQLNKKIQPNWEVIHKKMQEKFVTLTFLHHEYQAAYPKGTTYEFSQFAYHYRKYVKKVDITMRQKYRAGCILQVDFAGQTIPFFDKETKKEVPVQIFIAVMGCSNYTFAYAVKTQSIEDWIDCHNKAFWFFGGVTESVITDNLKAAVTQAGNEPVLTKSYSELAKHYRTFIVPARVRHPQDKAKAESGVLHFSRWAIPILRRMQFFDIEEINMVIAKLLVKINERPFKKLPDCRRIRFEELDKPVLRPLPDRPFEYAKWISARKVPNDYHLPHDGHYYSVPHELAEQKVETRITKNIVEFICNGKRVASHVRSYVEGGSTTLPEHQSKEHRYQSKLSKEELLTWAESIGPASLRFVKHQFERLPYPVKAIRACTPLKRLAKSYGHDQFEKACKRAESIGSFTPKNIRSMLQNRLTELSDDDSPIQMHLPLHENVRGASYYQ